MDKSEQLAYDEHVNAVMIQNDVLSTAALEGRQEGRLEGLAEGRQEGLAEGRQEGLAEGRQEGIVEGRQVGLEEGKQTAQRLIASKMKRQGIPIETIVGCTGLTVEEIETL